MVNGRNKGKRGELEFIALLQPIVDKVFGKNVYKLHRNLEQTRDGGVDIVGLPDEYNICAFEVKRCEILALDKWWKQACRQAAHKQIPVLAYKQNRQPWKIRSLVRMPFCGVEMTGDVTSNAFLLWYEFTLTLLRKMENDRKNKS